MLKRLLIKIIDPLYEWCLDMKDSKQFYESKKDGKIYLTYNEDIKRIVVEDIDDGVIVDYISLRLVNTFVNSSDEKDIRYYWDFESPSVFVTEEFLKNNFKKTKKLDKMKEL
jgi:hypothetical protein